MRKKYINNNNNNRPNNNNNNNNNNVLNIGNNIRELHNDPLRRKISRNY